MNASRPLSICWCLATLALIWAGGAQGSDGVVTPPHCDEAGFESVFAAVAASGGGTITFGCGRSPVTIPVSVYQQVSANIVIDGANVITFDGNNTSAFFQVYNGKSLTLKRLTLQRGVFNAAHALENFGTLNLSGVTMANNVSTDSAIENNGGAMQITSSDFTGNSVANAADDTTGAVLNNLGGTVTISESTFTNNGFSASTFATSGGAIGNSSGGALVVDSSTFTGNHAFDGGAIDIGDGTLSVNDSTFSSNTADYGGAIESFGSEVDVSSSRFVDNTASASDGGAIWNVLGRLIVDRTEFDGNQQTGAGGATGGGAISCYDDTLRVTSSTFSSNTSGSNGGAIYNTCAMTVVNSTFNNNAADTGLGGAISHFGSQPATVQYATIAGNSSPSSSIYSPGDDTGNPSLTLSMDLLANNTGGNCGGVLATAGYNLSSDTYCDGFFDSSLHDLENANLPLQPLANNGGSTLTMLPASGNQAINYIPSARCAVPNDQRGAGRPAGGACDTGAVELNGVLDVIFADGFDS